MAKLLVVATPIGNLNDLTPRMREALESADLVACEDTRVTQKLLNHFGLHKPTVSCHRHNEDARAPQLIERMLAQDLCVALTCDAGTPAISDPGYLLVRAAWEAGIAVVPVCGPSAATAALSAAGFDAREFAFYGFVPREKKPLVKRLDQIRACGVPVAVLYESPHRVVGLLEHIAERWPGCMLAVFCDISKKFESCVRGEASEVLARLRENPNVEKGEYCLVADLSALPAPPAKQPTGSAVAVMAEALFCGEPLERAEARAREMGFARNEIYRARLFLQPLGNADTD